MHSPSSTRDSADESGGLLPPGAEEEALAAGANAFTPIISVSRPHLEELKHVSMEPKS